MYLLSWAMLNHFESIFWSILSISNPIWPKFGSFPHAKWHHPCLVLLQHHLAGACTQPCQIVPAFLTRGYQRLIAGKMLTIMNLILPAAAFRKILGHFSQSRPWIGGDAQIIRKSPENVISTKRISYRLRNCGNIDPRWSEYLGMPWGCKPGEKNTHHIASSSWSAGCTECLSGCSGVPPRQVSVLVGSN